MKKLFFIICAGLIFTAFGCGGSRSTIEIKYDGKEIPFEEKSSWQTVQRALFGTANVSDQRHALRWITIRNYDFDTAKQNPNSDKLTAPGQVKIFLSLHDEAGTNEETPVKVAAYKGGSMAPMTFELINVYVFKDGKEERLYMYPSQQQPNPSANEVKITSVNGDTITGEINAQGKHEGKEFLVKGPFTAKIYKR